MEFLSQFLPIIIYVLLIILIVIGIVLGIKLIITIDKVMKIVDEVNDKVERISPLFNTLGLVSDKVNGVISTVFSSVENLIGKLFLRHRKTDEEELESE